MIEKPARRALCPPLQGAYYVSVIGLKQESYILEIDPFSQDGRSQPLLTIQGMAAPGSIATFQIRFMSSPDAVSQIVYILGDIDQDGDVDQDDLDILLTDVGKSVNKSICGTPCDLDNDSRITTHDARKLREWCTRPHCATESVKKPRHQRDKHKH